MKVLAFDTSSKASSVALTEDGKILAEVTLNTVVNHSVTLMSSIDFLMTQTGLVPEDIDRIAVAQGPGSYTGIRIAVTCGKTLAQALNCDLVGVSSLAAIALRQKTTLPVVILVNARRGMVYAGVYQDGKAILNDQHIALSELLSILASDVKYPQDIIFTGETESFKEEILQNIPEAKILEDSLEILPSAYEMAKLAEHLTPTDNIHDFNPLYLKKVEAEEKWEEANGTSREAKDMVSRA